MTEEAAYGVYFIPPPELAHQVGLAHLLLKSSFGVEAGGKFMPHCTLLAFIHPREGVGEQELISVLDQIIPQHKAFSLEFSLETDRFIRLQLEKKAGLMKLQTAFRRELWPLLSEYGQNKRSETGFHPHITLAFRDLPTEPGVLVQVEAYCQKLYQNFPKTNLTGNLVQLIEFKIGEEASWDAPDYWKTLSWRIIKGYTLSPLPL